MYLQAVKHLLFFLAISLFASACAPDVGSSHLSPPGTLQGLQERLSDNPAAPVSPESMEVFLRGLVRDPYQIRDLSTRDNAVSGRHTTSGELVMSGKSGAYIALVFHDLVADSAAYLQLYERFLEEAPPEMPKDMRWVERYGGFGWIWEEPGSDLHYLEAGLLDRLHIRIRSNLPDAAGVLMELAKRNNWDQMLVQFP